MFEKCLYFSVRFIFPMCGMFVNSLFLIHMLMLFNPYRFVMFLCSLLPWILCWSEVVWSRVGAVLLILFPRLFDRKYFWTWLYLQVLHWFTPLGCGGTLRSSPPMCDQLHEKGWLEKNMFVGMKLVETTLCCRCFQSAQEEGRTLKKVICFLFKEPDVHERTPLNC